MDKFSLDYNKLTNTLNKRKAYRLEDVKDKIEKVGFDVVRFRDNNDTDMLWKVEDTPDGPIIVALYDDETGALKTASGHSSDWSVIEDKKRLHVFYKKDPMVSLAANDFNMSEEDFAFVSRWLPDKLASDEEYQAQVLSLAGSEGVAYIENNYPELRGVIAKGRALSVKKAKLAKIAASIIEG